MKKEIEIIEGRKNSQYAKLSDYEQFTHNPFINGNSILPIKRRNTTIGSKDHILINDKTGEVGGIVAIHRVEEVDSETFIKIYTKELKDLFSLKPNAMKILSYILSIIPPNKDKILFDIDECKKYTGYSASSTILDGLSVLIENSIIARTEKTYIYYINPNIIFNGNRMVLINEYRRKTPAKKIDNNQLLLNYNEQQSSQEEAN